MLPSSSLKSNVSRFFPRFFVLAALASTTLAGCDGREVGRIVEGVVLVIIIAMVVQLAIFAALLVVLTANITRLLRGQPSLRWGVTGLVCGTFTALPMLMQLGGGFHPAMVIGLALAAALGFSGFRNVKAALRRDAEPSPRSEV